MKLWTKFILGGIYGFSVSIFLMLGLLNFDKIINNGLLFFFIGIAALLCIPSGLFYEFAMENKDKLLGRAK